MTRHGLGSLRGSLLLGRICTSPLGGYSSLRRTDGRFFRLRRRRLLGRPSGSLFLGGAIFFARGHAAVSSRLGTFDSPIEKSEGEKQDAEGGADPSEESLQQFQIPSRLTALRLSFPFFDSVRIGSLCP